MSERDTVAAKGRQLLKYTVWMEYAACVALFIMWGFSMYFVYARNWNAIWIDSLVMWLIVIGNQIIFRQVMNRVDDCISRIKQIDKEYCDSIWRS